MRRPSPLRALLCLTALAAFTVVSSASGAKVDSDKPNYAEPSAVRAQVLADVEARLAAVELPSGAQVLPAASPGSGTRPPSPNTDTPNLLGRTGFWLVPGAPAEALAWIEAHPPAGLPLKYRTSSRPDEAQKFEVIVYEWASLHGIADARGIRFIASPFDGNTVPRVDTQAIWIVPHATAELIPTGARRLEVVVGFAASPSRTWSIAKRSKLRGVAALLDSLPAVQPGFVGCGATDIAKGYPDEITLSFRNGYGSVVATANQEIPPDPCRAMAMTVHGKRQPPLRANVDLLEELRAIAG